MYVIREKQNRNKRWTWWLEHQNGNVAMKGGTSYGKRSDMRKAQARIESAFATEQVRHEKDD